MRILRVVRFHWTWVYKRRNKRSMHTIIGPTIATTLIHGQFCLQDVARETLHCACGTVGKKLLRLNLAYPAVKVKILRFKQVSSAKLFQTCSYLHFLLFSNISIFKKKVHFYHKRMYLNINYWSVCIVILLSMVVVYHLIGPEDSLC